jgi:hypothetical protein
MGFVPQIQERPQIKNQICALGHPQGGNAFKKSAASLNLREILSGNMVGQLSPLRPEAVAVWMQLERIFPLLRRSQPAGAFFADSRRLNFQGRDTTAHRQDEHGPIGPRAAPLIAF